MRLTVGIVMDELAELEPKLLALSTCAADCYKVRMLGADDGDLRGSLCVATPDSLAARSGDLHEAIVVCPGLEVVPACVTADVTVISVRGWAGEAPMVFGLLQRANERLAMWREDLLVAQAERRGLAAIAKVAAKELKNPFALQDTALRLIVTGGQVGPEAQGTIWEQVVGVSYTPNELFDLPTDELCFYEGHGRELYYADVSQYRCHNLIANVFQGDKVVAILCTTDIHPITQGQQDFFAVVRDSFERSLKTTRESDGEDPALIYVANSIISGLPASGADIEKRVPRGLGGAWRLVLGRGADDSDINSSRLRFSLVRLRAHVPACLAFEREGGIIALVSNQADEDRATAVLGRLGLKIGVSLPFASPKLLRAAYGQALSVVRACSSVHKEPGPRRFGPLYFESLVKNADPMGDAGLTYVDPRLYRLLAEKGPSTELIVCAKSYLACGCNLAKAADSLGMHRNTLGYKIERVEQALGMRLNELDEEERMRLWLSCRILSGDTRPPLPDRHGDTAP